MRPRSLFVASLAFLFAAPAVFAQSSVVLKPMLDIDIQIPFDFTVENTSFPPGKYSIRQAEDDPTVLILTSADRAHEVQFFSEETKPRVPVKGTYLEFDVVENRHYLSSIWCLGSDTGRVVPTGLVRTRHEKRAGKGNKKVETVRVPSTP